MFNERRASGETDFKRFHSRDSQRPNLLLSSQLEDSPTTRTYDAYPSSFKRHQAAATRSSIQVPKSRGSSNPNSFLFKQGGGKSKATVR